MYVLTYTDPDTLKEVVKYYPDSKTGLNALDDIRCFQDDFAMLVEYSTGHFMCLPGDLDEPDNEIKIIAIGIPE